MKKMFLSYCCAGFMFFAASGWAGQAEATPQGDVDARLKALEKRVQELEQQLNEQSTPRHFGQRGRDMNELWNRFRQDLEQFNMDPQEWLRGPHGPQGMMPGQRPRLGVELAGPNDEAAQQFNTQGKEGAVVVNVLPGSPADKGGLKPGDVITSVGGRKVKNPQDAVSIVRGSPGGKTEIIVSRKGELTTLNIDLSGEASGEETATPEEPSEEGWLRRTPPGTPGPDASGKVQSKTEVKASALELTDQLAKDLKLTDDQRKKMSEILDKESRALADEIASKSHVRSGNGMRFGMNLSSQASKLANQHADNAAKELANVLNADQLKQWNEYRKTHNSISVSQSMQIESSDQNMAPNKPNF